MVLYKQMKDTTNITVDYATTLVSADGTDLTTVTGTATILAGATTATIDVLVNGDVLVEGDETFTIDLSNPMGATIGDGLGVPETAKAKNKACGF